MDGLSGPGHKCYSALNIQTASQNRESLDIISMAGRERAAKWKKAGTETSIQGKGRACANVLKKERGELRLGSMSMCPGSSTVQSRVVGERATGHIGHIGCGLVCKESSYKRPLQPRAE